ncbi:MAG: SAM-dependent methyltransferase [Planctomycetota bacterium]|jgi:SAM-dependent methyltransferase
MSIEAATTDALTPADMQRAIEQLGTKPKVCPICDGAEPHPIFDKTGKTFYRCTQCQLAFVHAIYPEFAEDVDHLSTTYEFEEAIKPNARQRKKMDAWLKRMAPHKKTGKLLEVGCGQGIFLQYAREAGWDVTGVDVLAPVVEVARSKRGLNVHLGHLEPAQLDADQFDACFMSEVIEHIVDPVPLMTEIRRVLRPGGVSVVSTGNACSWSALFRGAKWGYYRFGGHLHIRFYGPGSARALAQKAGYKSVDVHTHGFAFGEAKEMKGKWYKLPAKVVQGLLSPIVTVLGRGHRLLCVFHAP